jgi:hypothetical protein
MLYDLLFDPDEIDNLAHRESYRGIREELSGRLDGWMERTEDPLCSGPVAAPVGSYLNDPDDRSPEDPAYRVSGKDP